MRVLATLVLATPRLGGCEPVAPETTWTPGRAGGPPTRGPSRPSFPSERAALGELARFEVLAARDTTASRQRDIARGIVAPTQVDPEWPV